MAEDISHASQGKYEYSPVPSAPPNPNLTSRGQCPALDLLNRIHPEQDDQRNVV